MQALMLRLYSTLQVASPCSWAPVPPWVSDLKATLWSIPGEIAWGHCPCPDCSSDPSLCKDLLILLQGYLLHWAHHKHLSLSEAKKKVNLGVCEIFRSSFLFTSLRTMTCGGLWGCQLVHEVGVTMRHAGPPEQLCDAGTEGGGNTPLCLWQTESFLIPPTSSLQPCHLQRCCCRLGKAGRSLLRHGFPLVTTPGVSSFFLFWAASVSSWLSAVSLAAKALAEPSVSSVFCLRAFAISGCYYLSCWAAGSSRFESRRGKEQYLWDGHAVRLARETSALFGLNAPPLLHCWGCHVCREFGKAACIYVGIYLNQIQTFFQSLCRECSNWEPSFFGHTEHCNYL